MIMNATESQFLNLTRAAPPPTSSTAAAAAAATTTMDSQINSGLSSDVQNQMIQKFSQQSGMTIEYSKL